jgi:hypothetical protein
MTIMSAARDPARVIGRFDAIFCLLPTYRSHQAGTWRRADPAGLSGDVKGSP